MTRSYRDGMTVLGADSFLELRMTKNTEAKILGMSMLYGLIVCVNDNALCMAVFSERKVA